MDDIKDIAFELLSGESTLGFYQQSRAYYNIPEHNGADFVDSLTLGVYYYEGGTCGEFTIEWTRLDSKIASRLKAFDGSWVIFPLIPQVFSLMAEVGSDSNSHAFPCSDFAKRLTDMGWRDITRVHRGRGDGFERSSSYGEIPVHLREFFPSWSHYSTVKREVDNEWLLSLKGKAHQHKGVLLLDNLEDALITYMRFT